MVPTSLFFSLSRNSDLDLVVLADVNLGQNALYKLSAKLRTENIGTNIEVIRGAKVPLVKFKERITGFACDVSFDIKSGISSSSVVKDYIQEWKVLRPMVLMIKYFLMLKVAFAFAFFCFWSTLFCYTRRYMYSPYFSLSETGPQRGLQWRTGLIHDNVNDSELSSDASTDSEGSHRPRR